MTLSERIARRLRRFAESLAPTASPECPLVHNHCTTCGHEIRLNGKCGCEDNRHPIGPLQQTRNGRLADEVNQLRDELSDVHAFIYNITEPRSEDDWKDTLDEQMELLRERQQAIVGKLPKTADGVPVVPDAELWTTGPLHYTANQTQLALDGPTQCSIVSVSRDSCFVATKKGNIGTVYLTTLFSTREAAEAEAKQLLKEGFTDTSDCPGCQLLRAEVEQLRNDVTDDQALAYNLTRPPLEDDLKDTLDEQIELMAQRYRATIRHLAHVAEWFQSNEPGTPVPEWCFLAWIGGEPIVEPKCIAIREAAEAAAKEQPA